MQLRTAFYLCSGKIFDQFFCHIAIFVYFFFRLLERTSHCRSNLPIFTCASDRMNADVVNKGIGGGWDWGRVGAGSGPRQSQHLMYTKVSKKSFFFVSRSRAQANRGERNGIHRLNGQCRNSFGFDSWLLILFGRLQMTRLILLMSLFWRCIFPTVECAGWVCRFDAAVGDQPTRRHSHPKTNAWGSIVIINTESHQL